MAIVRQDARREGPKSGLVPAGEATATVDGAISRRRFLVGAGVTIAATSALGPWVKRAASAPSFTAFDDGVVTGFSDAFEALANDGGAVALRTFDELVAANASSIRFPVHWDLVQLDGETFDWSYYDAVYREALFHGLKAHPVIVGCPEWVGASQRQQAANGVYYPTGSSALNAFGEFAVETLKHFDSFGDQVEAVEVWSEPNNPRGAYIANPDKFARMLSTVALFVDCANADGVFTGVRDREIAVLSGGLYATADDRGWEGYLAAFQEQAFPYELALHVPATGVQGVGDGKEYAERAAEEIGALVDRAAAQAGREVWVTGTGASAQPPWGEQGQALAMGSIATALAERSQCRAMMVTGLRSSEGPAATAIETPLAMSGLLRTDGTPTPALATLRTAWATP